MTTTLLECSLMEQRRHLADGRITSEALLELTFEHLKKLSGLNAYLAIDEALALEAARDADRRQARSEAGPLNGLPIAIKDNICLQGQPMTCGSRLLEGYRPPYDATVVTRLKAAGAILLGKTNLDEFAMGSSTETSAYGPCRNPWDPDRIPGGSSGGSAVAVAANMASAALGSDTGGSIRQPAAMCGVVGVKPTYGRVSRYGLTAHASSLDQIGTVTQTVADAAWLLQIIAGHDPRDATSANRDVPDLLDGLEGDVRGLRLGIPRSWLEVGVADEVATALENAIAQLAGLGATLHEVQLLRADLSLAAYYVLAPAEASSNLSRFDGIRYGRRIPSDDLEALYTGTRSAGFGPEVKRRIMLGTYALSAGYYDAYYGKADRVREAIRRDFARVFEGCDLLLTPTSPTAAFKLGERVDPVSMYVADIFTVGANLAGLPAVSIPGGLTGEGLPIGLQLIGPHFSEPLLLRTAHALEQQIGTITGPNIQLLTDKLDRLKAPGGAPRPGSG